jgi:hypothetical protein
MKASGALLLSLLVCAAILAGKHTRAKLLEPASVRTSLLQCGLPTAAAVLWFHCTLTCLPHVHVYTRKIQRFRLKVLENVQIQTIKQPKPYQVSSSIASPHHTPAVCAYNYLCCFYCCCSSSTPENAAVTAAIPLKRLLNSYTIGKLLYALTTTFAAFAAATVHTYLWFLQLLHLQRPRMLLPRQPAPSGGCWAAIHLASWAVVGAVGEATAGAAATAVTAAMVTTVSELL